LCHLTAWWNTEECRFLVVQYTIAFSKQNIILIYIVIIHFKQQIKSNLAQ
jgi:hypothetical protein